MAGGGTTESCVSTACSNTWQIGAVSFSTLSEIATGALAGIVSPRAFCTGACARRNELFAAPLAAQPQMNAVSATGLAKWLTPLGDLPPCATRNRASGVHTV